ncbi:MAG: hypothetical protein Q4G46_02925 [Propionibacteriaceae bacterium]|nr:hypothetical protein [Propionibacteriaceae bacterium]
MAAAVTEVVVAQDPPPAITRPQRSRLGTHIARILIIVAVLAFYFVPLFATAAFGFSLPDVGFSLEPLTRAVGSRNGTDTILLTLLLTVLTVVVSLGLLVPTLLFLHLKAPRYLGAAESLSLLPFVIPAVALVSGANVFFRAIAPGFLVSPLSLVPFYVVLGLPLVYRSLDAGFRAIDVRTLWSASQSLGATGLSTVLRVILPNLGSALMSASLLCAALTLGEYAVASLLLHQTFPVFMVSVGSSQPRGAAALSFITIILTWLLLVAVSAVASLGAKKRSKK